MALEAVVYPLHHQDPFANGYKDFYSSTGGAWALEQYNNLQDEKAVLAILDNNSNIEQLCLPACWDSSSPPSLMRHAGDNWDPNSPPDHSCTIDPHQSLPAGIMHHPTLESSVTTTAGRRKRRRTRNTKNKEEIENQRMTHIAVERNRRKQMNEYLAELRSLMPSSYVQRGDQASIIGGAINFVKELEQLLQTMEVHKETKKQPEVTNGAATPSPFANFFSFPQYSTRATQPPTAAAEEPVVADQNQWAVADIEVTMVETHANLKILSKKRPRQLLKLVAGLQCLRLSILHLNVTTLDQTVLYSVSVKVEDGCHLSTVDEIATAVNQLLHRIEQESAFS
ncbi:Transcription factor bHLH96 [Turnera subulata]|uniref:Transcription factor bHLH96 n=1 Tax=Turnera subulata TaxID=218843 RepID=A0A9Q0EYU5_9ROSI|nr:Transcription factor bHLH96 [Turnera subulata]